MEGAVARANGEPPRWSRASRAAAGWGGRGCGGRGEGGGRGERGGGVEGRAGGVGVDGLVGGGGVLVVRLRPEVMGRQAHGAAPGARQGGCGSTLCCYPGKGPPMQRRT